MAGVKNACFSADDLADGRVLVLIDALDEIALDEQRDRLMDEILAFHASHPNVSVIITSRPSQYTRNSPAFSRFSKYTVGPIGWKEATKILHNVQQGRNLPAEQGKEILRRLQQVHGIELNPLLVTVFAATSEHNRQDIPANITELFKKFTELMLGRWDENKGLSQQFQAPLKDFLLTIVAYEMHQDRTTRISLSRIRSIIDHELTKRGHASDAEKILEEIVYRSGLFRIFAEEVEFRHLLLQEFFAGRGIPDIELVCEVAHDDWWQRPIVFYFGENPSNASSLKVVLGRVGELDANARFQVSRSVGLAVQACYLSEVDLKLEIWRSVVEAIIVARDPVSQMEFAKKYPITEFLSYYVFAKDSVALSSIKGRQECLRAWLQDDGLASDSDKDARLFWYICALIELGDIQEAERLARDFHPTDRRLLVALHIGAYFVLHVGSLRQEEKEAAKRLCRKLDPIAADYRAQFVEELGSQLLEVRQGVIAPVSHDESAS